MYTCECCELENVTAKSKGIGYYCEICLHHWCWMQDADRPGALSSPMVLVQIEADHSWLHGQI